MNLKKIFSLQLLALVVVLSFIDPAFSQGKGGKRKVSSGVIGWVSQDFKSIAINTVEHPIVVTPQTKIFDAKGNRLEAGELRRGLSIVVESVRNRDGSAEKRIIIKR
jgi:hypothetical protein